MSKPKFKKLNAEEQKEHIFGMLCDFADYCDKYDLDYSLCGGTLLGAIRHEGFIPWDDDIDVFMPRPDFNRFHKLWKKDSIKDNYRLESRIAGNTKLPFAKILDMNTRTWRRYKTIDKHLWIDIFPLDGLPDDKKKSDFFLTKAHFIREAYAKTTIKLGQGKTLIRTIAKTPVVLAARLVGGDFFLDELNRMTKKYNFQSSNYVGGVSWSCGKCERLSIKEFTPKIEKKFNNRLFKVIKGYDKYLKGMYGDYMTIPSESDRFNHELEDVYVRV